MGFREWYVRSGRITRRTWWLHYTLPLCGLALLAGVADMALGYSGLTPPPADAGFWDSTGGPLTTMITLLTIVPSISSTVTRLHDRSHSARWLLWWLFPAVGWVVLFVQNGCLRGCEMPNRYGPAPQPGEAGTRWTPVSY